MTQTANKKKIGISEIKSRLDEIASRKSWEIEIRNLSRSSRNILFDFLNAVLSKNAVHSSLAGFHIFTGMNEVILNAIKSNLRHLFRKKEILSRLLQDSNSMEEAETLLNAILATSPLRDAMERYIIPEKIKLSVNHILLLENKIRNNKDLTDIELEILEKIRREIAEQNLYISMKIVLSDEDLFIRIRNNAPITQEGQDKIQNSRLLHKRLFEEGHSADFFRMENMNESESAGLGIALVDEGYYNMALDPMEFFNITSSSKAATIYMKYPLESLRNLQE